MREIHWRNDSLCAIMYIYIYVYMYVYIDKLSSSLGYPVHVCSTAEEAVRAADVIFTQTTATSQVL
jgi:hypothetical protein